LRRSVINSARCLMMSLLNRPIRVPATFFPIRSHWTRGENPSGRFTLITYHYHSRAAQVYVQYNHSAPQRAVLSVSLSLPQPCRMRREAGTAQESIYHIWRQTTHRVMLCKLYVQYVTTVPRFRHSQPPKFRQAPPLAHW
jgi:hypothetical protein